MQIFLIFFYYLPFTYSEMIITWGKLSSSTGCQLIDSGDCFDVCVENDSCIIAQDSGDSCYICGIDYFYKIQSLSEENANGVKIGIKANLTTCPESPNTTFYYGNCSVVYSGGYWQVVNPTTTTSTTTTTTTTKKPTTTTTKKPTTTTKKKTCPSGWTKFTRTMGDWCIFVVAGMKTYTEAQAGCKTLGGVLTGMETAAERSFLISKGTTILNSIGIQQGSIWLGLQRVPACKFSNENSTGCVPWANNAYYWTDSFTTGKSMMSWIPNQPDYAQQAESCVQMSIVLNQAANGAESGDLNDVLCSISTAPNNLNIIRGYACGQEPS